MNCHSFQLDDSFNKTHTHEDYEKIDKTLTIGNQQ